jgi:hypothetical protein
MAKHFRNRSYSKHFLATRLLALVFLSLGTTTLISEMAFAQQNYRLSPRRAIPLDSSQQTETETRPTTASPDTSSALGQALTACNQGAAGGEPFALPAPKGEITLDRCYKGRGHLICVVAALTTEATSLARFYSKVVDAKYPDLTTVEGVCKISPDTMVSDLRKSEEFAKRFKELKSQYEAAAKCIANVEQTFKNVSLADLTKASEVLQSITDSLEADVAELSKTQDQTSDLAAKMELSNKALKQIIKVQHAMCMNTKDGAQPISAQGR